jgi:hypothetical protein
MTTDGLVIPPELRTREIELDGREAGLKNARPAKRFKALVLSPISLSENDEDKFLKGAAIVRSAQWYPAFRLCSREEYDEKWEWWGLWTERFFKYRVDRKEPIECVLIILGGIIQGMMIVGPSKPANGGNSATDRLLYLAHMATAPWNRKVFRPKSEIYPVTLKGVGKALVKEAVRLSSSYGYGGRLGLHAMERSATFYRHIGMELVPGSKDREFRGKWYEFSERAAQAFLNQSTI